MLKKVLIGVACLVLIAVMFGGKMLIDTTRYRRIISDVVIKSPDLTLIQDGVYLGSFDAILISADVEVTVIDHKITEIILDHKNDRGVSAEVITDDVIMQQSLKIDTISGATNSSKVILKAIENALESGLEIDVVSGATS